MDGKGTQTCIWGKGGLKGEREGGKKRGVDLLWNNQRRLYGNVT